MNNKKRRERFINERSIKGITLVSLVVTIIILLILAGVTLSLLTQDELIEKAEKAVDATTKAQIEEEIEFELIDIMADCSVRGESLSDIVIQNELPNRLPDIKIREDLTGSYKGYEYEIEEDFKVHVLGTADNSILRTYLYKEGDECESLTNGWNTRFAAGENPQVGRVTKEEDNIFFEIWGTNCGYECYSNQKIDFANYTKMLVEINDVSPTGTSYGQIVISVGETSGQIELSLIDEIKSGIYECELANKLKNPMYCYIYVANGANVRLKNVWLEK